ncbi:MAG: hypothetical protein NTZ83_04915 [Candidatus Pacearchaeota archaeon]|nr:hypothetical protein [Candidatus Pacearchaeota archaeon]
MKTDKMKRKEKTAQGMKSKISPASPFKKKAQMKIQQMSFLLIAVFLFFALVGMVVLTVMMSDIKNSATDLREQNSKLLASKIANSPEFSCGEVYGTQKTDCIDEDKVMVLKDNINKYEKFWGISGIEIRRIYPKWTLTKDKECTETNYPNCNIITLISSQGFDRSNFVALCRKEKYQGEIVNKCEMAKIIIRYEEAK